MNEHQPLASYPRLNPAFVPVVVSDDEVHFTTGPWSGPLFEISDDDRDGILADLVSLLDGTRHIDEIRAAFAPEHGDDVTAVLHALQEKSIVRDAGDELDADRAAIGGYFSLRDTDADPADRIAQSQVGVVGAGAVGSAVVEILLEVGVDRVAYVDLESADTAWTQSLDADRFDVYEPDRLEVVVENADFVVLAADAPYPVIADEIDDRAHESRTPWTAGIINGLDGQIGPTVYPGETACYECFRRRADAASRSDVGYSSVAEASVADSVRSSIAGSVLPSFAHVVAGVVTTDILKQLAGEFGITTGSVINYDFYDFAVQFDEVLRLPRCERCGRGSNRVDTPRHVTLEHLADSHGGA